METGELERLSLEEPLPPMIYEAIWRSANYPRFCTSVARLGKQRITRDYESLPLPFAIKGRADTWHQN